MGEPAVERYRRALLRFAPALSVLLGWILFHPYVTSWKFLAERLMIEHSGVEIYRQLYMFVTAAGLALRAFVQLGPLAVGLGALVRFIARSRVRYGALDPLERVRAWMNARPSVGRLVAAVAGAWWLRAANHVPAPPRFADTHYVLVLTVMAILPYAAVRLGLRALFAPTLSAPLESARVGGDEIVFKAVAVTRETVGAVGAMAVLNVAMVAWLASAHAHKYDQPALAAFLVMALGGLELFRRASRVAVGVDGVHVSGSSRARFFAYRDLDAVRVNRGDIELVRGERVLVRLQLHGDDALKRDAITARIRAAIDRVKEGRGAASAGMLSGATPDELVRAAVGAADYRGAALTRDQLWALVEGPEIESTARKAAAEALAKTSDGEDRARLRVAAEHCAAPEVRGALALLAEEGADESEGVARSHLQRRPP